MKLYLISQDVNDGYDTYDAAVVCAPDEWAARNMYPGDGTVITETQWHGNSWTWCSSVEQVHARYLGEAEAGAEQGLVLASFNAG